MEDQSDAYGSYHSTKPEEQDVDQLSTAQPPSYHQQQDHHHHSQHHHAHHQYPQQNAFSTPVRSSHAEAQAALEAVAAAANAGKIQMTPPSSNAGGGADFAHSPVAAGAAAAAASASASQPSSPGATNSPFGTHLGRNKACQSCRARKLKCDGQKPVCGQCSKGWQIKFRMAQNKAKAKKKGGESPAQSDNEGLPEYMPACVYLPLSQRSANRSARASGASGLDNDSMMGDGSPQPGPSAPTSTFTTPAKKRKRADEQADDQVARMQNEIDQLRSQLAQVTGVVDDQSAHLANAFHHHHQQQLQQQQQGGNQAGRHPSKDELAIAHMLATSMPSGEGPSSSATSFDYQQHAAAVAAAAAANNFGVLDPALQDSSDAGSNGYPQPHAANARMMVNDAAHKQAKVSEVQDEMDDDFASPLLELMSTSWPADFPPPNLVTQLVTIYFEKTTAQSLFIHPAKFMESLSHGPQHPRFPSRGVLHGIFAHAYPRMRPSDLNHLPHESLNAGRPTVRSDKRESLKIAASFHAKRAQALIQKACSEGAFEEAAQIQALLVAYHYINDQSFDAWMSSGGYSSLTKGMELNRLAPIVSYGQTNDEERQTGGRGRRIKPAVYRATIKPPAPTALEHEERIRLFWNCFYSDRAACSSTHWAQNIDDLDIKTELPGAFDDFINATPDLIYRPRQTLESPNLFTEMHYDPALLHLKASVLHSRCVSHMSRLSLDANVSDVITPQFHQLDSTIAAMLQSVPAKWRELSVFDPMLQPWGHMEPTYLRDGVNDRPSKQISLMTNQLVMAQALMHGSCISLHEPVAHHVADSAHKASRSAQHIISIIKTFVAARVDLLQVGSLLTLMIVLAARATARQYKKVKKDATQHYLKLKRAHPELFSSENDSVGDVDQQSVLLSTAGINSSLEDEMEAALDYDPSLRARLDPESQLASLTDDLELIFWSLVKYGETYPLGVGQAKVVAQLLGKDYSSELEQSGLFKKMTGSGRGSSVAGSGSDAGNWTDTSNANNGAGGHPSQQPQPHPPQYHHHQHHQQQQQQQQHQQQQQQSHPAQHQHHFHQQPQQTWSASHGFQPSQSGHRLGSLYMERPSVSAYYPTGPSNDRQK